MAIKRGFYGVGIYQPQKDINIGTLWRSAFAFGAAFLFTVGRKYRHQSSDTTKASKHVPLFNFNSLDDLINHLPHATRLIGVELDTRAHPLSNFIHPESAVYLLGSEGDGLLLRVLDRCNSIIQISVEPCLNVSTTGSIVIYDRFNKQMQKEANLETV